MASARLVRLPATSLTAWALGAALLGACGPRSTDLRPSVQGAGLSSQAAGSGGGETGGRATAVPKPTGGRLTHVTLYHLASQSCPDPAEVGLPRCGGGVIASVSNAFFKSVRMQGSAKLCDGRVVGVQKLSPLCFTVVPEGYPWGMTASGRAASPFRSIAVDPKVFPLGHWYYAPELDGLPLPAPAEGKLHDGCVHADDRGGAVKGELIDWFVGPHSALKTLAPKVNGATFHLVEADAYCAGKAAW